MENCAYIKRLPHFLLLQQHDRHEMGIILKTGQPFATLFYLC